MSDKKKGIVYVATKKDRYLAEAFLSATSARSLMPEIPITLFTNLVDSAFASAPETNAESLPMRGISSTYPLRPLSMVLPPSPTAPAPGDEGI